ncbi:MAG: DUF45 domain-containing protein [Desulfobacterales bacterium]|jgi:predicted metal-dependent hydrolase|nr:DUF45 domain-containing protein [Desulfobacterales bacterium]
MTSKRITIDDIGEITLEHSRRAKHIRLSIRPFRGIRVAVPYGVSFRRAEEVTLSHANWLKKHLKKIDRIEQTAVALQKLDPIDQKDAAEKLVKRLNALSETHGFSFNKVFVKNQKTLWGSCSGKNNINLNSYLARLPEHLIDYTLLHELVHTRVKHHGPSFWNELEKIVVDAKKLDKELRQYRLIPERGENVAALSYEK